MSQFKGKTESEDTRECEAMRKMFVGGLNRDTTEDAFFEYFGEFGNMLDKVIIRDPQTRVSRGFGFITYDASDCVESVFQARPHTIDGKTLDVKRAMPREYNTTAAHSKVTKLFIGGIGPDLTTEDLQTYIESRHPTAVGGIDQIDFIKDRETNKNKGFGFLECSSTDLADRLTICENSFSLKGKPMSLKKAEPRGGEGGEAPRGRGGQRGGGFQSRGAGGFGGRGGRGRGRGAAPYGGRPNKFEGGYNNSNSYNEYSTGYPGYGNNTNTGFNSYQQQGQTPIGSYGRQPGYAAGGQGGYAGNQGQGWNNGGGNRYQPY